MVLGTNNKKIVQNSRNLDFRNISYHKNVRCSHYYNSLLMQKAMVSAPPFLHLLILHHCLHLQLLIIQFYNLHSIILHVYKSVMIALRKVAAMFFDNL